MCRTGLAAGGIDAGTYHKGMMEPPSHGDGSYRRGEKRGPRYGTGLPVSVMCKRLASDGVQIASSQYFLLTPRLGVTAISVH